MYFIFWRIVGGTNEQGKKWGLYKYFLCQCIVSSFGIYKDTNLVNFRHKNNKTVRYFCSQFAWLQKQKWQFIWKGNCMKSRNFSV